MDVLISEFIRHSHRGERIQHRALICEALPESRHGRQMPQASRGRVLARTMQPRLHAPCCILNATKTKYFRIDHRSMRGKTSLGFRKSIFYPIRVGEKDIAPFRGRGGVTGGMRWSRGPKDPSQAWRVDPKLPRSIGSGTFPSGASAPPRLPRHRARTTEVHTRNASVILRRFLRG